MVNASGGGITPSECRAMRLLADDGWTQGELKMTFHLSGTAMVRYHTEGRCSHAAAACPGD